KFDTGNTEQNFGVKLLKRACEEPMRQIAQNAGFEGSVVVNAVLESKESTYGFNARTEKYEDLVKAGVIDPTKVSRTALENAASVAGLLLTTEAMIANKPEKKEAAAGGHDHDHGGGYGDDMDF
ncbi:MAG: chaperonin GroEL, partial [Deltaproteobacteria bacterium]|nr:chaperonin GroEL [Deltaproteobacteria bacterium]